MKKYLDILKRTKLFSGLDTEEISSMLTCLGAALGRYEKGTYVFHTGEHIQQIAVLVKGRLIIRQDDCWGNCAIISSIAEGELFGEAYAAPDSGALLNDVVAAEDSEVIFFDVRRVLTVCPSACRFHSLTVQNLFFVLSEKNRQLVTKLGHMSKRTTREKLLSYLSDEARRQGASTFEIPFNRQQLADFLSVDRSAMSSELGRMQRDGLLRCDRNRFTLLGVR